MIVWSTVPVNGVNQIIYTTTNGSGKQSNLAGVSGLSPRWSPGATFIAYYALNSSYWNVGATRLSDGTFFGQVGGVSGWAGSHPNLLFWK